MSGHNKWSKIHRKKGVADQQRGNLFTKLGKAIALAAKKGNSDDPDTNFSLRMAIDKARQANMPKDNIKRAIDRGMGKGEAGSLEEVTLEGYGPSGVAVIVDIVTDNRNRTVAELKNLFEKSGGSLAEPGSVLYQFERKGIVSFSGDLEDEGFLAVIDLGAEDVEREGEGGVVICPPESVSILAEEIGKLNLTNIDVSVMYQPTTPLSVENLASVEDFLDKVDEHEDVQEVFSNVAS